VQACLKICWRQSARGQQQGVPKGNEFKIPTRSAVCIRVRHVGAPPWTSGICCGASARYEPAFRDNEINGKVETKLTVEDLKELGISAWGTARMLLDAIAQLCADANTESAAAPHPSHEGGATPNGRHMVPLRTSTTPRHASVAAS
jgi:hypothetical protein